MEDTRAFLLPENQGSLSKTEELRSPACYPEHTTSSETIPLCFCGPFFQYLEDICGNDTEPGGFLCTFAGCMNIVEEMLSGGGQVKPIVIRVKKKKLRAIKLVLAGVLAMVLVLVMDSRLRPLITMIASYQAKLSATRSINNAVIEVISKEDVVYNNIISMVQDENGEIASIETDMITVNRLKSEITNQISDQLLEDSDRAVLIPIGTVLGGQLFSGRGPNMEFRILPAGYVHTEIYNNFESAGINQTLHQIMLSVDATVSAVAPVYTTTPDITTNFCIAETVIVGKVPQAFTDINGDKSSLLNMRNDYAAEPPAESPAGIS